MRRPFGEASPGAESPHAPHKFRPIEDFGIFAAAAGGVSKAGPSSVTDLVVADNFLRKSGCGMQGCGKPRYDPIHEPAD